MSRSITLELSHPKGAAFEGFRFFWAFRVSGFRPDRHCQPCLRGSLVEEFSSQTVRTGSVVTVALSPRHRFLYVCGVGSGPRRDLYRKNFHFPLRYEPNASVRRATYNGFVITARNAVDVPIPPLEDGWGGRDRETTRCRNFQFGVACFGGGQMEPVRPPSHCRQAPDEPEEAVWTTI